MSNPKIIGITGPFGSGKTTAANFFESKGYKKISLSSFLEDELKQAGKKITRKNLQDIGNLLRKKNGAGYLAKKAIEFTEKNNFSKITIDGIRNLGEVHELKKLSGFVLLGIFANRNIRFERIKNKKGRETLTKKLFDQLDYRDLGIDQNNKFGLQVAKCFAISDYFIDSNSEKEFYPKLENFLNKL